MVDRFGRFSLAIFEISRHWHKIASEVLAEYGLKSPHAIYLTVMRRHQEGITMPQLCEECGKDKSDASRMIAILERKGFVKKLEVNGSRYRGLLVLTEEGKLVAEGVFEQASRAVKAASQELTEEMRDNLYQALDSITANLRKLSSEGIPKL